ncbi:hypothetical protein DL89DRAFT_269071, partial [Linderina pennispora]
MSTSHLHIYRQLLREVNKQFTSVSQNRFWATQLRLKWSATPDLQKAQTVLTYLTNNRRYKELLDEFQPKMPESDRITKTANRVGLEIPKSYSE